MIDNKKIEEASFEETFGMYGEGDSLQEGFTCGALMIYFKIKIWN